MSIWKVIKRTKNSWEITNERINAYVDTELDANKLVKHLNNLEEIKWMYKELLT